MDDPNRKIGLTTLSVQVRSSRLEVRVLVAPHRNYGFQDFFARSASLKNQRADQLSMNRRQKRERAAVWKRKGVLSLGIRYLRVYRGRIIATLCRESGSGSECQHTSNWERSLVWTDLKSLSNTFIRGDRSSPDASLKGSGGSATHQRPARQSEDSHEIIPAGLRRERRMSPVQSSMRKRQRELCIHSCRESVKYITLIIALLS